MSLDLPTIVFFAALIALAQLLVPLFFSRIASDSRVIPYWAAGTICSVAGFLLFAMRDMIPAFFSVVLPMTLHVMSGIYLYTCCRLFAGKPAPPRGILYGAATITFLFILFFTYVENNVMVRSLYYSIAVGAAWLACAVTLPVLPDPRLALSYRFTAGIFALYGTALIAVRIPLLLLNPFPAPAQTFTLLAYALGNVLWTMGFAFMVTQRLVLELNRTATHDFLTETLNRRAAQARIDHAIEQLPLGDTPLSVLLLDIDHFKQINDQYGHDVGDQVLVGIATLLRKHVRGHDMVARWGGEEFVILLQGTGPCAAMAVAERLIRVIADTPLVWGPVTIPCHVSIGIATAATDDTDSAALIRAADHALYHAKRTGRNRVVAHQGDTPEMAAVEEGQKVPA